MVERLFKPITSESFFLFGARGTGKTQLLKTTFFDEGNTKQPHTWYVDLLNEETEELYSGDANLFEQHVLALDKNIKRVIIDEVQRIPRLLDVVHRLSETKIQFILTGSSARKLKSGGANLLAGRAFVFNLHPLTHKELGRDFELDEVLAYGSLPGLLKYENEQDKQRFLKAYIRNYLKEEVWAEQLIKDLNPFRKFLEVAAQMHGRIINFSKIARDVGVDSKTIKNYYSILEETLLGFFLLPYSKSVRKQQLISASKFYLFDSGVKRAIDKTLSLPIRPKTYAYGDLFEHFIIAELIRLNDYYESDFTFSYFKTSKDSEIDLIIERPGQSTLLMEIKSSNKVDLQDLKNLKSISNEIVNSEAFCISKEERKRKDGEVMIIPWQETFKIVFGER